MESPEQIISDTTIAVYNGEGLEYPDEPPYSPHLKHPEYFLPGLSQKENGVYDAVRNTLQSLGLDKDNFNTPSWNPLQRIIKPGDTVVIKPNFVISSHEAGGELYSIITHPAVIRAAVDYVYIALQGKGRIIIADAPQMDCDFAELLLKTGLLAIPELYRRELGFNVEIYDLRDFWLDKQGSGGVAYARSRHELPGDPAGNVLVSLGKESLFYPVANYEKFYGADYTRQETIKHHHGDTQEYLISKTILSADVIISVPKLKVHKKVGVTLNMKGLVGACTNKNYLVHYRLGAPAEGGDQFPDHLLNAKERTAVKWQRWAYDKFLSRRNAWGDFLFDVIVKPGRYLLRPLGFKPLEKEKGLLDAGNWHGNDSAWRMAVDLTRIFFYADANGIMQDVPVRRMLCIIDGVIGGENNGPLTPDARKCGLIIAGFNPCAVDLAGARLMGFDYKKIGMLKYVTEHPELFKTNPAQVKINSNGQFGNLLDDKNKNRYFGFSPHPGWQGHIEIEEKI